MEIFLIVFKINEGINNIIDINIINNNKKKSKR